MKRHIWHNFWVLEVGNNDPISTEQSLMDLNNAQIDGKTTNITMMLAKRGSEGLPRTNIDEKWASFDQMKMVKMKVIDLDVLDNIFKEKDP